ncbi:MAG: hypothetical protein ACJ754_03185 [Pyrinomonadaceae bacterium]
MTTSVAVTATPDALVAGRPRELPPGGGENHMVKFSLFYDELAASLRPAGPLQCSVLHLAACKDSLPTPDGPTHGVFTQAMLDVLATGFDKNYEEFRLAIADLTRLVPGGRRPFIEEIGVLFPNFKEQHPVFAI